MILILKNMITTIIILAFTSSSFQLPLSTRKSTESAFTTTISPIQSQQNPSPFSSSLSSKRSTLESTTSSSNMVTVMPRYVQSYYHTTMKVLIPQNFPGKFYYPPCKCELVNQIRYYNPKTREFYYHKAYTAIPPHHSNNKDGSTFPVNGQDTSQIQHQGPILAGEPEFYPVPAIPANTNGDSHVGAPLPAPASHYMPSNQYYNPYMNHQMVNHNGPPQGPYMPFPLTPGYNRSMYNDRLLYRNPYGGYYTYSTILDDASGVSEGVLLVAALFLWFYSLYRLYSAWQNTLNFSEAQIQGPQGWDLLVSWVAERIRIRQLKVPGITPRRKANYPAANSEVISITSQNGIKPNFSKVDEDFKESHNGYRMEINNITDEAIQHIEELASSNACPGGGIDIQNTICRIVEGHTTHVNPPAIEEEYKSPEDQIVLLHNSDSNSVNTDHLHPLSDKLLPLHSSHSIFAKASNSYGRYHTPLSHSVSTDGPTVQTRSPNVGFLTSEYSSLPPSITTSLTTPLPAEKCEIFETTKAEVLEAKPSIPSISVVDSVNKKRAKYGRSKTSQFTINPSTSPCSVYMVDEIQHSTQELCSPSSTQVRTREESAFMPGSKLIPDHATTSRSDFVISPSRCDQHNDSRKRFLMRKQVSEDVSRAHSTQMPKNVKYDSNIVITKYSDSSRSPRNSQEVNNESDSAVPYDFKRENGGNSNLLGGEESTFGNWSSIINYNSSFDSRTEFEDRISPDNAL